MLLDIAVLKEIFSVDCVYVGNKSLTFNGINTVYDAVEGQIAWIKPNVKNNAEILSNTNASCIICNEETFNLGNSEKQRLYVISKDPKLEYFKVLKHIRNSTNKKPLSAIHETAIVDKNCIIGKNVTIGAYSVIGSCTIGDNTQIGEFVKIFDSVTIGANVLIRENVSIGGEGFGFYTHSDGTVEHIPHIGSVKIGNNVQIFPFANIDRGTLGSTEIGNGSVIDHYVHVGHNSKIGESTIVCANSVLAGGSKINNRCFIGVNTLLKEKCEIGNDSITGIGAVVVKNIPDSEVWVGNPAKFLKKNEK
ncbi:MAG: hypothetical protein KF706_06575 [Chitinophagales bacterium]|nr:hypothetical protein [Chitinophagales bacterium]